MSVGISGVNLRKQAEAAGSKTRVQGVTGNQTVKNAPAILHRLVISGGASAATVTLVDGAATLIVLDIPASTVVVATFNMVMATSLIVNPSASDLDTLVVYD